MTVWMVILVVAYGAVAAVAMLRTHLEYRSNRSRGRFSRESLGLAFGIMACLVWPLAVLLILIALQIKVLTRDSSQHYS